MVANEIGICGLLVGAYDIEIYTHHYLVTHEDTVDPRSDLLTLGPYQPYLVQSHTSCAITLEIIRLSKCFNEGEFIKKCDQSPEQFDILTILNYLHEQSKGFV